MADGDPDHADEGDELDDQKIADDSSDASDNDDAEPLEHWQPPRGRVTRIVAWIIVILFLLCIAGFIAATISLLNAPVTMPAATQP